jgi:predicted nucleic acid-binding Zn ribbon protein
VPIYDYRCGAGPEDSGSSPIAASGGCGLRFERLMGRDSPPPACPECGGVSRKVPSRPALHGKADVGLSREQMPQTWRGTYNGNREYLTAMQRKWDQRQRLEAKHPELAGDTRPVAAHEGRYEQVPLRVGDPVIESGKSAATPSEPAPGSEPAAPPSHGHGHGHGHSHGSDGA